MIGRPRNLRSFWSRRSRVIEMTRADWAYAVQRELAVLGLTYEQLADMAQRGEFSSVEARKLWVSIGEPPADRPQGIAEEAADRIDRLAAELAAVRGQRHAAVDALREMSEGVRLALVDGGYFHSVDPVAGVRRLVKAHRELTTERQHAREDRDKAQRRADALATECDQLRVALEAAGTAPISIPEQDRRNCIELTERNTELRSENEALERQVAELQGRKTQPDWTGNPTAATRPS